MKLETVGNNPFGGTFEIDNRDAARMGVVHRLKRLLEEAEELGMTVTANAVYLAIEIGAMETSPARSVEQMPLTRNYLHSFAGTVVSIDASPSGTRPGEDLEP